MSRVIVWWCTACCTTDGRHTTPHAMTSTGFSGAGRRVRRLAAAAAAAAAVAAAAVITITAKTRVVAAAAAAVDIMSSRTAATSQRTRSTMQGEVYCITACLFCMHARALCGMRHAGVGHACMHHTYLCLLRMPHPAAAAAAHSLRGTNDTFGRCMQSSE